MTLLEVSDADPGLVALGDLGEAETNSEAPFPLTPALSRGRGRNLRQPETNANAGNMLFALLGTFPLPEREGQGEGEADVERPAALGPPPGGGIPHSALRTPHFESLEASRPLPERARSRKWRRRSGTVLRPTGGVEGYAVHVFCNNDGERGQRGAEIWEEYGLGQGKREGRRPKFAKRPILRDVGL